MHLGNIARAKNYVPNKGKYYGRFNIGVVTINLPDVALSAKKKMIDDGITYVDDEQWDKIQKNFSGRFMTKDWSCVMKHFVVDTSI